MKVKDVLSDKAREFETALYDLRNSAQRYSEEHDDFIFNEYKDVGILKRKIIEKLTRVVEE